MSRTVNITVSMPEELVRPLELASRDQLRSRSSLVSLFIRDGLRRAGVLSDDDNDRTAPEVEAATR